MITKAIYKRQLHDKLDAWNKQISELKEQADHAADADAKAEYNGQVEEIHALELAARRHLNALEHAEETAWEHLKEDIEIVWDKLEFAVKRFIELYR